MYVCVRVLMDVFGHIIFNCFIFSTSVFFPPFYSILIFLLPSTRLFFSFFIIPYYTHEDRILPYDGDRRRTTLDYNTIHCTFYYVSSPSQSTNHRWTSWRTFVFFSENFLFVFVFKRRFMSKKNLIDFFLLFFVLVFIACRYHACLFHLFSVPLTITLSAPPFRISLLPTTSSICALICPFPGFIFPYFSYLFDYHLIKNASSL